MDIKKIIEEKLLFQNQKILIFIIFILSILMSLIFLLIERKLLGLGSTYHPDAAHYMEMHNKYSYLSLNFSLVENLYNYFVHFLSSSLYYSVVQIFYDLREIFTLKFPFEQFQLFSSAYRNIIKFNMLIFALTNLMIFSAFLKLYKKDNNLNLLKFFIILIFCFLPYKLHFCVNVLKETLIFFLLTVYAVYPSKITLLISFFFGTPLRGSFGIYFVTLIEFNKKFFEKYKLFIFVFIIAAIIFYYKNIYLIYDNDILKFLENRNIANMGGREYDNIPNFTDYEIFGSLIRMILWPIFILSGSFAFFSDNYLFYIVSAELILLQFLFFLFKKRLLINLSLIIFLCLVALYVNTFTSYVRYCYLAINIFFIKEILKTNYNIINDRR